ncbi:hypothetical protein FACS189472_13300 [Alphaproteobacteria bacterium]|nr:hypothetical protein FACS189472_13300 [Alphaproteobacteria bacterium]
MLTDYVNSKIHQRIGGIDKAEQLQSIIDPELHFRRNSINLYIGRRGSGKTFNVLRELIKLSQLPNKGGYNSFIYCTDKTNDSTVKELLPLIKLKTRVVSYADMQTFLKDLVDAKMAYQETLEKGLENRITDRCKKDLLRAVDVTHFGESTPGTVVLYDDAINIFKSTKNKSLLDLLHRNRQPKITYFLCMQDGFGLPPQVKRNLDTCILFGGFNDSQMLNILLRQLNSSSVDNNNLGQIYRGLSTREGLIFDYLPDETTVKILKP